MSSILKYLFVSYRLNEGRNIIASLEKDTQEEEEEEYEAREIWVIL
jgi:hypothetical protein